MPDDFDQLVTLIRARFAALSPQFQSGAAFLLDHPDEVAVSSMRAVAARAQVQPASLVRLAQQLGFPGWNALRALFVARVRARPEPMASRARTLVAGGTKGSSLARDLLVAQQHNLAGTAAENARALTEVARLLRRARHVHVAGFRSCYALAFGLAYGYRLFRPSVSLLDAEGGTLDVALRGIARGSATIVVSFAPYSVEAVRVAEAALERGSRLVAITDSAVSPIALNADNVLIFTHDSPSFFPSLVGATALAESLVAHLLALEGADALAQLEQTEQLLNEKGAYVR